MIGTLAPFFTARAWGARITRQSALLKVANMELSCLENGVATNSPSSFISKVERK